MALIKNFGIAGIGQSVQYGKGGGKVVYDTGGSLFKVTTTDGTTLTNLGVADPSDDAHAANKKYVDQVAQGLDVKDSVRAATSGNIALDNAPSVIDGETLAQYDRVLVKAQTTASQNGIYVFPGAGGEMERAEDMDAPGEFVGAFFFVEEGTANSDQGFVCSTNGTVTPGSTDITFSQFTGTGQITAGTGLAKVGNTISAVVDGEFITIINDVISMTGTDTTGEVLKSDGQGGVVYGTVNLASADSVAGILPLANGGTGANASTESGLTQARLNLGLGSMATQNANDVDITGGKINLTTGELNLADNQISGDKISGGIIDSASLTGGLNDDGTSKSIGGFDITVGTGKILDVDGKIDVDGAAESEIDNVAIGITNSAAGRFSTMTTIDAQISGGAINSTTIGTGTDGAREGKFTNLTATDTLKADTVTATGIGDITFNSKIIAAAGIDFDGASIGSGGITADTIDEKTLDAGVTVDGVLLKDDGTGGGVTAPGTSSFNNATITTATINAGTINNTTIGAGTSADGTFSKMTTADADISGGAIANTNINMSGKLLTLDAGQISGSKIDGGTITDFASIGIDDNVTPLATEGESRTTTTILTLEDTSATFNTDLFVDGNLTVAGTTTTVNSTETLVADRILTLNAGESGDGVTNGAAGIEVDRGSYTDGDSNLQINDIASILWNETDDVWEFKLGNALADLRIGSQSMDGIAVNTINELTPGNGITFGNDVEGENATFSTELFVPKISETVTNAGVTIDEVLLKDGGVVGSFTAEATDTVDVSAALNLIFENDQISGDSIEGGTIGSITISSLAAGTVDIDNGTIDGTAIGTGLSGSAVGTFSTMNTSSAQIAGGAINSTTIGTGDSGSAAGTFSTLTSDSVDLNGGFVDDTIIGAGTSAAGTFSIMTTDIAQIAGGAITGASLTSDEAVLSGGSINVMPIGMALGGSSSGKFSTLVSDDVTLNGGTASLATVTAGNLNSDNVTIGGGTISGTNIDLTGQTLTLAENSVSGNVINDGTITDSSLLGKVHSTEVPHSTISQYDITVGNHFTLDVSAGTLTLADNQILGDKIHGGVISNFSSTGIDDTATSATVLTLENTLATFGVAGDFGANTLDAGAATFDSLIVEGNAEIRGNLTVSGEVITTLSETVLIEDNMIELNSNLGDGDVPGDDSGIIINRGGSANAQWYWDEADDVWSSEDELGNMANIKVGEISATSFGLSGTIARTDGGTGTDTSTFANDSLMITAADGVVAELAKGATSTVLKVNGGDTLGYGKVDMTTDITGTTPIANGGTGVASIGVEHQVLISNGTALAYGYQGTLRYGDGGALAIDTSGMTTGDEYLDLANSAGRVTMTAKNALGTGLVDLYLQGQNGGDVFLVGQAGEAVLQGDDDTDLTVSGGNSDAANAGDLILKGGNGGAAGISGDVIIKGGLGGATAGKTQVLGANDTEIVTFVQTSTTASDSLEIKNGTGGIELAAAGTSADVNLVLAPKGDGMVMLPDGTEIDFNSSPAMAVSTKKYVDDEIAKVGDNFIRNDFAANGTSQFTVGNIKDVSGKIYYVKSVTIKIVQAFVNCDEITVSDGTNTLVSTTDVDMSDTGLYIIEQGYETATPQGQAIIATLGNNGSPASPAAGQGRAIVSVEYKAINA